MPRTFSGGLASTPQTDGAAQTSANPSGVPHQRLSRLRPNKPRSSARKVRAVLLWQAAFASGT
jgi:hypothetical protein